VLFLAFLKWETEFERYEKPLESLLVKYIKKIKKAKKII
jgi:hypothetical protein